MARPSYETVRFDSAEGADAEGSLVQRYDVGELAKSERTREGFLRTEGVLTRSGVFEYTRHDGTKFKELRHPDEVFSAEALASLALVPLTLEHPPDLLTPETVKGYQTGSIGTPRRDGDLVKADILITDAKAIAAAESGRTGLSCGYNTHVYKSPGVYRDSAGVEHKFDTVQTRIRGNHVAQTNSPRAGDVARLRMDDAAMVADDTAAPTAPETPPKPTQKSKSEKKTDSKEEPKAMATKKITINGHEYEVPEEVAARLDSLAAPPLPLGDDSLKKQLDETRGKLAAVEAELQKRTDSDAEKEKRLSSQAARKDELLLYAKAAPILKKSFDELVVMDALEIMREVIKKEQPKIPLDGQSDEYVKGVFNTVTSRVDSVATLNAIIGPAHVDPPTGGQARQDAAPDPDKARLRANERAANAWKPKEAAK